MIQLKTQKEMKDAAPTSSIQVNLHSLSQHPKEAQESSLPHRLTISFTSSHIWWTWRNTAEAHREHQHPQPVNLCCSSVDTSTHWHYGKWSSRSAGKTGRTRNHPHHICLPLKPNFHSRTGGHNPNQNTLHQLALYQQTTIFRLRTGHRRLNCHLKRFGMKTSGQCPCGETDQTPQHSLQSCSLYRQAKQQIWPISVPLQTKLWGSAEDMFLTSQYAALMGRRSSQCIHHINRRRTQSCQIATVLHSHPNRYINYSGLKKIWKLLWTTIALSPVAWLKQLKVPH